MTSVQWLLVISVMNGITLIALNYALHLRSTSALHVNLETKSCWHCHWWIMRGQTFLYIIHFFCEIVIVLKFPSHIFLMHKRCFGGFVSKRIEFKNIGNMFLKLCTCWSWLLVFLPTLVLVSDQLCYAIMIATSSKMINTLPCTYYISTLRSFFKF